MARQGLHLQPVVLAVALALSFVAGAAAGPLVGLIESAGSVTVPALEFDATTFRSGERQPLFFDDVQFRCEEQERC